jgi:myo-inositol-1(or 4)-monophosphatase
MNATLDEAALAQRFAAMTSIIAELGELAEGYFRDRASLGTTMKGAQDFLTAADGAVEACFRRLIAARFPDDAVVGEEMGGAAAGAPVPERLWIIDPIDGTANFARGDLQWCVSVGFVAAGVPTFGAIRAPALGETYLARRGGGATVNGVPVTPEWANDIGRAIVEFGWSTRVPTERYLAAVAGLYAAGASVKRGGSGALGIVNAALGRTDGYGEHHINAWDVAAALVIAGETGARCSDFCSGAWLSEGNPVLVTAPQLWDRISHLCHIS